MPSSEEAWDPARMTGQRFATTHWSWVVQAAESASPEAQAALGKLCQAYWYPLYGFIRRSGHKPHDAQDATQEFLGWLIESRHLRTADPDHGKFRSFLLIRLKHFLSDERKKQRAKKRGGGQSVLSLEGLSAEERHQNEPACDLDPELLFDRHWALTVLERTLRRLRSEYEAAGCRELFEHLAQFQPGEESTQSYLEVAKRLGLTESAIKSAVFRLRRRHADVLRDEIAQTVATVSDVDQELRYLAKILSHSR